ncbi:MAG: SDR family oxidoreductase [Armatimonadota bacterium]|nr:SDR family oxidoreductase [Armatimonadota bacterium]
MLTSMKINGRVALVTGANHGIGAAIARVLAAHGASVALAYLREPAQDGRGQTADMFMESIIRDGGRAVALETDLSDPANITPLFAWAEAALGPVDILINNAAVTRQDTFLPESILGADARAVDGFPVRTITAKSHDHHFALNSRATALLIAEFARRHIERGADWGRIVSISTDGAPAFRSEVSYGASKYAIESYSRAAAQELGPFGVTVNVISPGPIQTGWITPDLEASLSRQTPLGRVGQPEDVADVVLLLCSEQARWLTGQLLSVSGGLRLPQ